MSAIQFTGKVKQSQVYFENPEIISRYLRVVNPLRSLIYYPIYSSWAARIRIYNITVNALRLLLTSPSAFLKKLLGKIGSLFKTN